MRSLLVITGNADWCYQQISILFNKWRESLSLSDSNLLPNSISKTEAKNFLGREFSLVIYDLFSGLDADALCAISGTVRDKGYLVLLGPEIEQWKNYQDPLLTRFRSWRSKQTTENNRFLKRLAAIINYHPGVELHTKKNPVIIKPEPDKPQIKTTTEQKACIEAIGKVSKGQLSPVLLITADRGRGKSTALGIAARQISVAQPQQRILVTAANPNAVKILFQHARNQGAIEFYAIDRLLEETPKADLLLVDEAAALSLPLLEHLSKCYRRIVFSTTIHGYEGSGRGFRLRFLKHLANTGVEVIEIHLNKPVRWQQDDPLEHLMNQIFLLDLEVELTEHTLDLNNIHIKEISQQSLVENNSLLEQVYYLLNQAHYQTKPSDLKRLLDDPDIHIELAMNQDQLLAVMLMINEGGFPEDLAKEIVSNKRRPHGHLALQTLALYHQRPSLLKGRIKRIMRIAVQPSLQNNGIGSKLLQHVINNHQQLITSFAADYKTVKFWIKNAFVPLRLSHHMDNASGCYSLIMGCGFDIAINRRFEEVLKLRLSMHYQQLDPKIIWLLINHADHLTENDQKALKNFSKQALPEEAVLPELVKLTLYSCSHNLGNTSLLIQRYLQKQDDPLIITHNGLIGKKDLKRALRRAVAELLSFL